MENLIERIAKLKDDGFSRQEIWEILVVELEKEQNQKRNDRAKDQGLDKFHTAIQTGHYT